MCKHSEARGHSVIVCLGVEVTQSDCVGETYKRKPDVIVYMHTHTEARQDILLIPPHTFETRSFTECRV